MKSVVVLQARTNSTRLPAKVLLPIAGLPLVILAAKRAGNTGRPILIATSSEPSDDYLAEIVDSYQLKCFRGSLNNTLDRFVSALIDFPDDTLVFRLTADNVVPDGQLLDDMAEWFLSKKLDYLCCSGPESGLPYGVSAELTRLSHLREAAKSTSDPVDLEHVTPFIIRQFGRQYFTGHQSMGMSHFRCTVDTLDDYLNLQKLFHPDENPINSPMLGLVEKLKHTPNQPVFSNACSSLIFGSVQLGLPYGINNQTGQPLPEEGKLLVRSAIINGVEYIDTARAYGQSESVIGSALSDGWSGRAKIISKLSPLQDCPEDASGRVVDSFVDSSIFESLFNLRQRKIDILLLHRARHITDWQGAVFKRLKLHQHCGRIGEIGVSIQNPTELSDVLDNPDISHIQLPYNLLDWRWSEGIERIRQIRQVRTLRIHVRSALLQGLFLQNNPQVWERAHVLNHQEIVRFLGDAVLKANRKNIADLCFAYLRAENWIDGIVVGMETKDQLLENLGFFNSSPLSPAEYNNFTSNRPLISECTLNPATWVYK